MHALLIPQQQPMSICWWPNILCHFSSLVQYHITCAIPRNNRSLGHFGDLKAVWETNTLQGNLTFQTSNPNHAYNKGKQRMFTKQLNSTLNLTDLVANMEDFSYFGHYTYWVHTVSHCRSVFKLSMQVFRPTPEAYRIACFIVRRHSWVKLHVSS